MKDTLRVSDIFVMLFLCPVTTCLDNLYKMNGVCPAWLYGHLCSLLRYIEYPRQAVSGKFKLSTVTVSVGHCQAFDASINRSS